ncbi:MAG: hypothetical protein JNM39_18450 [Bdellovibrionaceae bacterium]|nr:hypothetical protein [Pseudobdellovibrionaceae bacterium]
MGIGTSAGIGVGARKKVVLPLICLGLVLFQTAAKAAVWKSEKQWSVETENEYSKWVTENWKADIFVDQKSLLYQIATDCADASYDMRALFAYTHKLPFRAGAFTNEMREFDHIRNEDQRFREFIVKMNSQVSTGTLARDTYPIEISRKSFRPGIIYLSLKPTNHSLQIVALSATGVPTILDSTEPSEIRKLQERQMFPPYVAQSVQEGFRAFKWPEHYAQPVEKIPGYSLQQFEIQRRLTSMDLYFAEYQSLVAQRPETRDERAQRFLKIICNETRYRIEVVDGALEFLRDRQSKNQCLTRSEYEGYSSPSRDRKMAFVFQTGYNMFIDDLTRSQLRGETLRKLTSIFSDTGPQSDWCPLRTKSNLRLSLWDVWLNVLNRRLASDPHVNEMQRWGFEPYVQVCPKFD